MRMWAWFENSLSRYKIVEFRRDLHRLWKHFHKAGVQVAPFPPMVVLFHFVLMLEGEVTMRGNLK